MSRPPFGEALEAWREHLSARGRSAKLRWAFRENLRLDPFAGSGPRHRLRIQTFAPPVEEADAELAYRVLQVLTDALVFEALVCDERYTLCTLAFDEWNVEDGVDDYRADWDLWFASSNPYALAEEVRSLRRWRWLKLTESRRHSGLDHSPLLSRIRSEARRLGIERRAA